MSAVRFCPAAPVFICGSSSAVEHRLAKARVASSNLVFRSIIRRHSQVVRQRSAKPLSPSSNLGAASKKCFVKPCLQGEQRICRGGGTGRRKGLKIPRSVSSVPVRFRSSAPFKSKQVHPYGVPVFVLIENHLAAGWSLKVGKLASHDRLFFQ